MRAFLPRLAAAAMLLVPGLVAAQQEAPAPPAPAGPVLRVADSPDARPVPIERAEVRAVVNGPLSETTLTLTFRNDENRVLEGELTFPLPDGATVSGYGLDVGGVIVEGVPVEKQQARVSYEKEVRKGIDPGIIEHVSGNNFRTRVYPIPAQGTRTVRVQFVSELSARRDGSEVFAPLAWPQAFADCAVRLEVVAPAEAGAPVLRGGPDGAKFEHADDRFVAEWTAKAVALDKLAVVVAKAPAQRTIVERRPKMLRTVEDIERMNAAGDAAPAAIPDDHYFLIQDAPVPAPLDEARPRAKRIGVLWDASLSREKADHARELRLLVGLLARLGDVRVDLIVFRNTPDATVSFEVKDGNAEAVVTHLRKVVYDGGTNLGVVAALADATAADGSDGRAYFLLFSDGVSNLGPADAAPRAEVPVYALSGQATANHAVLRHLARESGGAYVNLAAISADEAGLPDADGPVLDRIGNEPFALVSVEHDPAQVADVLPSPGEPIGGRLLVSGRLLAPEATVKLNFGHGKRVTHSQTYTLRQADAVETGLVPRFWAQQRVADLSVFAERNAAELLRLGKEFVIVTPTTSLIVLETADQYVEHRIVPPASRPEVYAEFVDKIERRQAEVAATHEQKVQRALAMWQERVAWWETKFEYASDLVVRADGGGGDGRGGIPAPRGPVRGNAGGTRGGDGAAATQPGDPESHSATIQGEDTRLAVRGSRVGRAARSPAPRNAPAQRPASAAPAHRESTDSLSRAEESAGEAPAPAAEPESGEGPSEEVPETRAHDVRDLTTAIPEMDDAPDLSLDDGEGDTTVEGEGRVRGGGGGGGGLFGSSGGRRGRGAGGEGGQGQAPAGMGREANADFEPGFFSKDNREGSQGQGATVSIQPWDPNTPYLQAMKTAGPAEAYDVYLDQRKAFGAAPAFYLDCASYFLNNGRRDEGIRVLTNVAELHLEDARLLRVVAHRLAQIGELDLAVAMFERILKLRPEEPQSHRDLALALADRADRRAAEKTQPPSAAAQLAAMKDYLAALMSLNNVILGDWDRFEGVQVVALMEANRVIERAKALPHVHDFNHGLDPRLVQLLDLDVRVVLTWDADQTDIDLWVTEPSGEICKYDHNRTTIGGLMSKDFTQGYGPEEYCLRRLMPGKYKIQANFYGSGLQQIAGPTTVQATVITNFGRPTEKRQALTLRLTSNKEIVDIGTVTLTAAAAKP